ncbi:nuclear nucleic acid-binding protein C1D [Acipenser oxyrinchus oxyrinchus]|uniref:Nuclear nucleic acid-binding protein C1D n=1 Tax=Acipenser oxyrinchus oxyrinchus TaxID=40147 RepID=A0AAD8LNE2_ACIOX|nr:nuclear nucleic acid-binding protein C1D [Acipenser ruthenus]XP_033861199.1 nuclear nucleic acid-binding protein C1D [Acipenser ruthenus]KAK1171296.1 nuclear nucleic acid-binding protein C1D [Acipenser oxyrinchus oxyrinchus]
MADQEVAGEEYPKEILEYLTAFESSLDSVDEMLKTMMSVSRGELLNKLDPLEQAKLDLVSAYSLNSLFWIYLVTQGINPKEHAVKQELERIRTYMNKVKEITDRKKAARLDKGAAARFVRNALWEAKSEESKAAHGDSHQSKRRKQQN